MGTGFGPDWTRWAGSDRGKNMGARPEGIKNDENTKKPMGNTVKSAHFGGQNGARPWPGPGLVWAGLGLAWASPGPAWGPIWPPILFSPIHFISPVSFSPGVNKMGSYIVMYVLSNISSSTPKTTYSMTIPLSI